MKDPYYISGVGGNLARSDVLISHLSGSISKKCFVPLVTSRPPDVTNLSSIFVLVLLTIVTLDVLKYRRKVDGVEFEFMVHGQNVLIIMILQSI